jgi:hypothetical protein
MATTLRSAVLNPEGHRTIRADDNATPPADGASATLAQRLDDLNGKTVYLVDTGFGGSDRFLDEMQAWFALNMPSVKAVRRKKPGHVFRGGGDDSKELWVEIKDQGDAAVLGVAG